MRRRGSEIKDELGFWMVDLHCHSTHSDGAETPAELVHLAEAAGLTAVALTDHDTVSGVADFLAAGAGRRVRVVPGVEVACQGEGSVIMHVVGLWVDHQDTALRQLLRQICEDRHRRNLSMLERLRGLGCPLELPDVQALAGGGGEVVGRPHFARALVARGYCRSHRDAFDRFLGRGKPAYVGRRITPVERALEVLSAAGAVCIWAHPLMGNSVTGAYLRRVLTRLRPLGLDGIEVYYSDYGPGETRVARETAEALGLLQSGGTDYHGSNIPGIRIGVGRGGLDTPDALLVPLEQRAREKAQRAGTDARRE
jgi:predicted metal-dependent phosphoesterase TrpH